jgi:microcystin-dependent protein
MSNFFQSTNINAGKYYQNGIEIDLGGQGAQGAQGVQGAQGATSEGGLPVGSITMYMSDNMPPGANGGGSRWLLCNGQTLPETTEYQNLRNFLLQIPNAGTVAKTPNMQQRFALGAGTAQQYTLLPGQTGGVTDGKITIQHLPSHTHSLVDANGYKTLQEAVSTSTGAIPLQTWNAQGPVTYFSNKTETAAGGGVSVQSSFEPPWFTVNFIIYAGPSG